MNIGFMQQLAAQKKQGQNLGSAESMLQNSASSRLGNALNVQQNLSVAEKLPVVDVEKVPSNPAQPQQQGELTLGATFANEIIRRMGVQNGDNAETKDSTALRHSLGQTMDWVRDRFGDETAAAAAGMVLQSTSSGVNEETIGEGLLNTLKFIDRNFGIAAGDAAIAQFNQGINGELNNYFENGKAEVFHATTTPVDADAPTATQDITSRLFIRAVQDTDKDDKEAKSATEQLLEDLKKELDKTAELQDLTTQLEEQFNPAKATSQAMNAYAEISAPTEPQFTSIAV